MESARPLPIEKTIAELGNSDKPLFNSRLAELSNLSSEALEAKEAHYLSDLETFSSSL